jgi:integrase
VASLFARGRRLWLSYKDTDGTWRQRSTGYTVDERRQALAYMRRAEQLLERRRAGGEPAGPATVQRFGDAWIEARRKRGVASVDDDHGRLRNHVYPHIGTMPVAEVRTRHLIDLFAALRETTLAPRTIYQVRGLLHTFFKSAIRAELIAANPVAGLDRTDMPKKVDKDPTWRAEAIYTRGEIERLISDEQILPDRRVVYGLKAIAMLRHGEVQRLRWRDYDPGTEPLGKIQLGKTKSGVPRAIPVHPTLAAMLAAWKLAGWERTYGRRPEPDDLIVPTRNMTERQPNEAQEGLIFDLEMLGLRTTAGATRKRRGHDLRRAGITLYQVDGADRFKLEAISHGPRGDIISVYTTFPWPALCAEIAKLKCAISKGGSLEFLTGLSTAEARARKRWGKGATLTGFEPVLPT